jgi:hypothetical protein
MELLLEGHNPSTYEPDTWNALTRLMMRREELEFLKLTVIVSAIVHAGKMASGNEAGDGLKKALQTYRSVLFPEIESDLLEKAQQNIKILEEEYKKGPLKVQSLEYSTSRRKKR